MILKTVIILGPPSNSGKELGEKLSKKLGIPFLHMGDIIQQEIRNNTQLGLSMKKQLDAGELLSNVQITSLITSQIPETRFKGLIINGYPRTIQQLKMLKDAYQNLVIEFYGISLLNTSTIQMNEESVNKINEYWHKQKPLIDYLTDSKDLIECEDVKEIDEIIKKLK